MFSKRNQWLSWRTCAQTVTVSRSIFSLILMVATFSTAESEPCNTFNKGRARSAERRQLHALPAEVEIDPSLSETITYTTNTSTTKQSSTKKRRTSPTNTPTPTPTPEAPLATATFTSTPIESTATPTPTTTTISTTTATQTPTPTPEAPPATSTPDTNGSGGSTQKSLIGINLAANKDWTSGFAFVDAFRSARPWTSGNRVTYVWDDGRALDVDANGWVRSLQTDQVARTPLLTLNGGAFPSGSYTVLYDGEGTLVYAGTYDGRAVMKNTSLSKPNREVIDVNASYGGFRIEIVGTNPSNYLRNIRVIMPGGSCSNDATRWCATDSNCSMSSCVPFESSYTTRPFHPLLLESLQGYGTIRFMDWMETNGSAIKTWSERPKVTDAFWTKSGVPAEVIVDLANQTGTNPWFNMPHQADDAYIAAFANLVRGSLRSDLTPYIEYSNEVWNSGFAQYHYASSKGLALGLDSTAWGAAWKYYAQRSTEIFKIWQSAYDGDVSRLKRVIASQAVSSYISSTILSHGNAYQYADALAIAPYFGFEYGDSLATTAASWNLDQLFADIESRALPEALQSIRSQKTTADSFGLPLIAYESGQHMVGVGANVDNVALTNLLQSANRDVRIKRIYQLYIDSWFGAGGKLLCHFNHIETFTKWGSWGSAERYPAFSSQEAPKMSALKEATTRYKTP